MNELLFFDPILMEKVWGGDKMKKLYGYPSPSDKTGEAWTISAHPHGDCFVKEGAYKGKKLSELWKENRELFGNLEGKEFPLMMKIIDAKEDLSIQVHPDDEYAGTHENGSLGKMESWYILDCDPNSTIIVGHHAKTREEVRSMIENGEWNRFLGRIPIQKGDFFHINPGTVHAIQGGTLVLEIEQSSDITYRVYDYGRLENGKPRELHTEKALDVIKAPSEGGVTVDSRLVRIGSSRLTKLVRCPYYVVEKLEITDKASFAWDKPFVMVSVTEGVGSLNGREIKAGDHFIVPSDAGAVSFEGRLTLILAYVNEEALQ